MVSTVNVARASLHDEYARLRVKIFDTYRTLALVGRAPGAAAHKLPRNLGHWHTGHSELVRAVAPVLEPIVERIEEMRRQRDPKYIKAHHTPLRRGDNFRRRSGKAKVQLNPGEWPPKWRSW